MKMTQQDKNELYQLAYTPDRTPEQEQRFRELQMERLEVREDMLDLVHRDPGDET